MPPTVVLLAVPFVKIETEDQQKYERSRWQLHPRGQRMVASIHTNLGAFQQNWFEVEDVFWQPGAVVGAVLIDNFEVFTHRGLCLGFIILYLICRCRPHFLLRMRTQPSSTSV